MRGAAILDQPVPVDRPQAECGRHGRRMASLSKAAVEGALPDFCQFGIWRCQGFVVRRVGLAEEFVEDVVIETPFETINQGGRIAVEDALAVEGVGNADVMLDVPEEKVTCEEVGEPDMELAAAHLRCERLDQILVLRQEASEANDTGCSGRSGHDKDCAGERAQRPAANVTPACGVFLLVRCPVAALRLRMAL